MDSLKASVGVATGAVSASGILDFVNWILGLCHVQPMPPGAGTGMIALAALAYHAFTGVSTGSAINTTDVLASLKADMEKAVQTAVQAAVTAKSATTTASAVLLMIGSMAMVGCQSTQDPNIGLFNAEAGLTTVAQLDVAYRQLPVCSPSRAQPCFDSAVQAKIAKGISDANVAMVAAEKTVLGCDLPTYIASHQTPPTGTCGPPVTDQTAAGAAVAIAQNAITAAQALIPIQQ